MRTETPRLVRRSGKGTALMTREEVLARVDHTLLKPEARWQDIRTLCDEALKNHTASVCINSCYVRISLVVADNTDYLVYVFLLIGYQCIHFPIS